MDEKETRKKLQELLDWIYANRINYSEANLNTGTGKNGYIEFHINKIYKEFGGIWNDTIASNYFLSLEDETKYPAN